jgi:hypothetical protein
LKKEEVRRGEIENSVNAEEVGVNLEEYLKARKELRDKFY